MLNETINFAAEADFLTNKVGVNWENYPICCIWHLRVRQIQRRAKPADLNLGPKPDTNINITI